VKTELLDKSDQIHFMGFTPKNHTEHYS